MNEGLVIKILGSSYTVLDLKGNIYNCRIKGSLRLSDSKSTNPIAIGDKVIFDIKEDNELGIISFIKERKNYIIRKSTNLSKQYQIIASNVDQAFLIVTLKEPITNLEFVDRFLVSAEAYSIPVIIILNKIDLYDNNSWKKLREIKKIYNEIGYNCIETSVLNGTNIDLLKNLIENKITVLNGNSGVGKSLLIKRLNPSINIKIGEISSFHKSGIHTTSYNEMYKVNQTSFIIDTPGIKGFGLIDFYKEEIYHYFPEIFKFSKNCKFNNCTHIHEPGCAIIQALENGDIAYSRYTSYYNLFFDANEKYRK